MKVRIKTAQFEFVELEYKDRESFEDNYTEDYVVVKMEQLKAEELFANMKTEKIASELLSEMNEKKFENLTEADKVANCFDQMNEARKLRRIVLVEKMKIRYKIK